MRAAIADALGLPAGIPVLVGSADTPAASYALGARPGGRPLLIMGTTHVVANALDAPDLRARALQRVDVRPGRWLINGVTNGGDALGEGAERLGYGPGDIGVAALLHTAFHAQPAQMSTAPGRSPILTGTWPVVVRGASHCPAWPDPRSECGPRGWGVVEGVLFADRMIIESCIGAQQRSLYFSGAFGTDPELPQLLADTLDREIQVVDESHLPAIGAAAMCGEVLRGEVMPAPRARIVQPRPAWRPVVASRWEQYRQVWSAVTGTRPRHSRRRHWAARKVGPAKRQSPGWFRRLRLVIDKKLSLSMVAFELQTGSCVGARAQTPRPVRTIGRVRPARRGTRTA